MSLPTAYFMALRPLFPIWQAQCIQVFLGEAAPFCKLSAVLAVPTILPLPHSSQTLALTLLHFLYHRTSLSLTLAGTSGRSIFSVKLHLVELSLFLSGCDGYLVTHFFRAIMTQSMSWPEEARYSSHLLLYVSSLHLPLVSSLLSD